MAESAGLPDLDLGVVDRTGYILVHEGEVVVPPEASKALLANLRGDGRLVLEFPVEVEVRVAAACDPEEHADHALTRLLRALDGLA